MAQPDEDTEKQHEPTQKKLDDARRKGEFPKSVDLNTAAGYLGLLIVLIASGPASLSAAGGVLASLIEHADGIAETWFEGGAISMSGQLLRAASAPISIWFVVPAALVLSAVIAQRAFVVAPDKLRPKLSRISPLSNLKNKFGSSGLFEFFKSFLKLVIYSIILGVFLFANVDRLIGLIQLTPSAALQTLASLTAEFLAIVFVVAVTLGAIDLTFQHSNHLRKNRMSRKELTDETKQSEGDPHVKQQRRQKAYDIATNRMLEDVPSADVVIVNPTHYAVALKWTRSPGSAPECVAKGTDEVAARIREIASENAIPVHSDPPTARALFATVEIGHEVPPDQYQAVAAAIRFAEKIRQKAAARQF